MSGADEVPRAPPSCPLPLAVALVVWMEKEGLRPARCVLSSSVGGSRCSGTVGGRISTALSGGSFLGQELLGLDDDREVLVSRPRGVLAWRSLGSVSSASANEGVVTC